jgi:hypothetical protein
MKTQSSQLESNVIFSDKEHTAFVKKTARIKKAKVFGYQFSKLLTIAVLCLSLISVGSLQVFAGYSGRSSHQKVSKSVKVRAGNNNHFGGNSRSKASVHNNNSVHINSSSSGGSGRRISINRGGGKAHHRNNRSNNNTHNNKHKNNNSSKKVVRKVVKKDIDRTVINKNITVNKYADNSCNYNNCSIHEDSDYHYLSPCSMYHCTTTSDGRIVIINKNINTNHNYNSHDTAYASSYEDVYTDDSLTDDEISYLGY